MQSGRLPSASDYRRIERAIGYLTAHYRDQPTLADVAHHVGLSEFHFQRLFRRWAGISPKRFVQYLTANHAASRLRAPGSLLEVAHDVGVSGSSRLHDLFVNVHAMTPGEWRARGAELRIGYGFHPTPFGDCLIGVTDRGICHLAFVTPGKRERAVAELAEAWSKANLRAAPRRTRAFVKRVFGDRIEPRAARHGGAIDLLLKGTNFQIRVWEALLTMPAGAVTSYEAVAAWIGAPRAVRAVATAVAQNMVAFLIPCHRVIRKSGAIGEYRWGAVRKQAMLAWEAAHFGSVPSDAETGPIRNAARRSD